MKHSPIAPNNIARALAIKDEELFLLCERNGDIPHGNNQGFGLYYHDCRYLNGYELTTAGTPLNALESNSENGFMAEFELTNPEIKRRGKGKLKKQSVGIRWQRVIAARELCVREVITCTNFTVKRVQFPLSFSFKADFEDIFEIRGLHPPKSGRKKKPAWRGGRLLFAYDGADELYRALAINIFPAPKNRRPGGAGLKLSLGPGESRQIRITFALTESSEKRPVVREGSSAETKALAHRLHQRAEHWLKSHCQMRSNSILLNRVFERSMRDLRILKSSLGRQEYFSAGLPWYSALFGRDSIIASLQTLAFQPEISEHTLRLLAKYQGSEINDWRDEEPGKIMHELRVGELAHLHEIPQTPYYGSVDSTPLFLILVARHANWTGNISLFRELKEPIERAFAWIKRFGDKSGKGYLEYDSKSKKGLGNQGWKDSGDAITNEDGSLAKPPIALVEVQGYVYLAKISMAEIYERDGDRGTAKRLRAEARELQAKFERDFWIQKKQIYGLALEARGRLAAVVSSNPGQVLWSGIASPDRARKTAEQLLSPSMFSGWGVRTLSSQERRFNPVGYHLGTVWPHDNSIIAAGLRNYGLDEPACDIFSGIIKAAQHFEHYRLPEVFAGFSREAFSIPVRYPVACHPQAWAAGSIPFMLESLLGLVPDAFNKRLQIVRPVLPAFVDFIDLQGLQVGRAIIDLHFQRAASGAITTNVVQVRGPLDVEVSTAGATGAA